MRVNRELARELTIRNLRWYWAPLCPGFFGRQFINLAQHLLDTAADLLALLAQADHLAAERLDFFLAQLQLLAQTRRVALRRRLGNARMKKKIITETPMRTTPQTFASSAKNPASNTMAATPTEIRTALFLTLQMMSAAKPMTPSVSTQSTNSSVVARRIE